MIDGRTFLLGTLLTASFLGSPADLEAQNSTRKIRSTPNDLALSSGSAIAWREDLPTALKEAKSSKKPVFWYVPTLEGSFMDRQVEVDRYMMSGPFSWPRLAQALNEDYIPVRAAADRDLCKQYALKPVAFIEPGFLVFSSKGKETLRLDRIATLHPDWFLTQLQGEAIETNPFPGHLKMETAARLHRTFPRLENGASLFEKLLTTLEPDLQAEATWLYAAGLRDAHEEDAARTLLKQLITRFPEHMLSAKAAMELAGNGPYWQGFESYVDLPAPARTSASSGTLAAPGTYDLEDLQDRAVRADLCESALGFGYDRLGVIDALLLQEAEPQVPARLELVAEVPIAGRIPTQEDLELFAERGLDGREVVALARECGDGVECVEEHLVVRRENPARERQRRKQDLLGLLQAAEVLEHERVSDARIGRVRRLGTDLVREGASSPIGLLGRPPHDLARDPRLLELRRRDRRRARRGRGDPAPA